MKTAMYVTGRSFNLVRSRLPLMKMMRDQGYRVIAAACEQPELTPALTDEGIEFFHLPIHRTSLSPTKNRQAICELRRLIDDLNPQFVHNFNPKPILLGGWLKTTSCRNLPMMATLTGLGFERNWDLKTRAKCFAYRLALRNCSAIQFENETDREFAKQSGMVSNQNCFVSLSSGVDLSRHIPKFRKRDSSSVNFLFASRLLWSKGVRELFCAAEILRARYGNRFRLIVAGEFEDSHKDRIPESYVRERERSQIIDYRGQIQLADMPELYSEADVIVLPSYREGFSRVLLEGAAMGKALLATDIPGCREAIDEKQNGLLIPVRSVDAIVDAMDYFMRNPELTNSYGKHSRRKAEAEYSDRVCATKTIEIYKKCGLI